jgi:hypothetical protein
MVVLMVVVDARMNRCTWCCWQSLPCT